MTHYEDISTSCLYDAMIQAIEEGMAAGFSGSKSIDGKTPDEWVTSYIRAMYDEDFGKEDPTPVLFLWEQGGNKVVFAYFPEMVHDIYNMTCYSQIGQHSACSSEYAAGCKKASAKAYAPLLAELIGLGYNNLIIQNEDK